MYTFPPWSLSWFHPSSFLGFPPSRPSATCPQNNTHTSLTSLSIQKKKTVWVRFWRHQRQNMGPALPTPLLSAIALLELPLCLESKKQSQMMNKMLQIIFNSHHMDPIVCKSVQTLGVMQEQQLLISSARLTDCFPGFDSNSAIFPLRRNPLFFKGHHS